MKDKIVIVIHTDYPWPEGMSYRVHNMARTLSRRHAVMIVSPILESDYPEGFQSTAEYTIHRTSIKIIRKLSQNRLLYRLLFVLLFTLSVVRIHRRLASHEKVRLVQAEQQLDLLPGIMLGLLYRVPVVVDDALSPSQYYSDRPAPLRVFAHIFELILFRRASFIIGSSSEVTKLIHERYNVPRSRLAVVPNGVAPPTTFGQERQPKGKYLDIIFAGNTYSEQNRRAIRNLIDMFPSILADVTNARLVIIGGPLHLLRQATRSIHAKEVAKNILMTGLISEEDKRTITKNASVCALPFDLTDKLIGGVRLKALEFLSWGKVVVSTPTGVDGIEGATNGENLLIAGNMEEFRDFVIQVLSHPENYDQMRKSAVKLAAKYHWDVVLGHYPEIIEDVSRAADTVHSIDLENSMSKG